MTQMKQIPTERNMLLLRKSFLLLDFHKDDYCLKTSASEDVENLQQLHIVADKIMQPSWKTCNNIQQRMHMEKN